MHPEPQAKELRSNLFTMVSKDLSARLVDAFLTPVVHRLVHELCRLARIIEPATVRCHCCAQPLAIPVGGAMVSLRGLARRLCVSHTTVLRSLHKLHKLGAVSTTTVSRCHTVVQLAVSLPCKRSRGVPGQTSLNYTRNQLKTPPPLFRSKIAPAPQELGAMGAGLGCTSIARARDPWEGRARSQPPSTRVTNPCPAYMAALAGPTAAPDVSIIPLVSSEPKAWSTMSPEQEAERRAELLRQVALLQAREALAGDLSR